MPMTKRQARDYKAFLKRRRRQIQQHRKSGEGGSFWDWLLGRKAKEKGSDG